MLVMSSAEAAKDEVMQTKDHIFSERPFHAGTDIVLYGPSNIVSSSPGDYWKLTRKIASQWLPEQDAGMNEDLRRNVDVVLENINDSHVAGTGGEGGTECLLSVLLKLERQGDLTMDNVKGVMMVVSINCLYTSLLQTMHS
ncbi:hypothetical protein K1719_013381 [Acacia pycnantha]|nr:hypothetical protein K1719_013381 [Acacia pycnantha]